MNATTLHRPAHREALWELEDAFGRGEMVTVFGRCTVEYDGRASSSLAPGDRLLVLKPDGSALVHTDRQRTPVNWQPPGCEHRAAVRDGRLRVRSRRSNPDETLDVSFESVAQLSAFAVTGGREADLDGSEEQLRRRVLDDPAAIEPGFTPIETEHETDAGPMDIYGEDADGTPTVIELKRRRVGPSAASQLRRYVDALRREAGLDDPRSAAGDVDADSEPASTPAPAPSAEDESEDGGAGAGVDDTETADADPDPEIRGILVAPSITDRTEALLAEAGLEFVALDPATGRPPDEGEG